MNQREAPTGADSSDIRAPKGQTAATAGHPWRRRIDRQQHNGNRSRRRRKRKLTSSGNAMGRVACPRWETDGGSTGHATGSTLLQRTRPRKVLACRAAAGALLGPRPALCAFERCPLRVTHTFSVCWQLHSFPQACSCQPGTVPSPTVTGADEPPRRATYGGAGVAHQGEEGTGERG